MTIRTPAISIATSLVPSRDLDLQLRAVTSWQAAGFTVTTVNAATELEAIARDFADIARRPAPRTAEKVSGKPMPLIRDLLEIANGTGAPDAVVGLINSDIVLRADHATVHQLAAHASNAMVMLPRVDVSDRNALEAFQPSGRETFSVGYDGVFLPARMIADIPESVFAIGMPFWDYWLPLMAILRGHPLKAVASPIALHVAHASRWDGSVYVFFHALVSDLLRTCDGMKAKTGSHGFDFLVDALRHVYGDAFDRGTAAMQSTDAVAGLANFYDRLQEVIVHHIKLRAVPITLSASSRPGRPIA